MKKFDLLRNHFRRNYSVMYRSSTHNTGILYVCKDYRNTQESTVWIHNPPSDLLAEIWSSDNFLGWRPMAIFSFTKCKGSLKTKKITIYCEPRELIFMWVQHMICKHLFGIISVFRNKHQGFTTSSWTFIVQKMNLIQKSANSSLCRYIQV